MGLLDVFFDKDKKQQRQVQSLRKKLHNMWTQSPERNFAAEQLRDIGTPEAIEAMLERFKLNTQNTTYDNEEKLYLYDLLVALGTSVVEPIKGYVRREEQQTNWALRVLDDLMSKEEMAAFLTELLGAMDIDYQRDPEKKHQIILRAKNFEDHEPLQEQVARFAMDDSEGIRFVAVSQIVTRGEDWAHKALQGNLRFEDSGRVLDLVCDRFVAQEGWCALEDPADANARRDLIERLPSRYFLSEDGFVRRK